MPDDTPDPGLQPGRTALAWQRTALSAAVSATLLLRGGIVRAAPLEVIAGAVLAVVAVTAVLVASARGTAAVGRPLLLVFSTAAVVTAGTLTTAHLLG